MMMMMMMMMTTTTTTTNTTTTTTPTTSPATYLPVETTGEKRSWCWRSRPLGAAGSGEAPRVQTIPSPGRCPTSWRKSGSGPAQRARGCHNHGWWRARSSEPPTAPRTRTLCHTAGLVGGAAGAEVRFFVLLVVQLFSDYANVNGIPRGG